VFRVVRPGGHAHPVFRRPPFRCGSHGRIPGPDALEVDGSPILCHTRRNRNPSRGER
jgi:hypothetical protein